MSDIATQARAWSDGEVEMLVQRARSAEREIGVRRALDTALADAGRIQSLARANEELIAVVAHDPRTPLQVISLTSSPLSRVCSATVRDHSQRIDRSVDAMRHMIDGVLAPASRS